MSDLEKRIRIAERILFSARELLLEGYTPTPGSDPRRAEKMAVQEKSSFKDLVTLYDSKVECFLREQLEKMFPGEYILGEESASKDFFLNPQKPDSFWVIDPIDGTTNYFRAYPFFSSTMAWVQKNSQGVYESVLGLTFQPLSGEMFLAWKGGGAWLNRSRLSVTRVNNPQLALLTTGFASERSQSTGKAFELFTKLTQKTLGVRRDGSAALDLAYVAAGRIDAYWEWGLAIWDIAAGILLVQEAGGNVTAHASKPVDLFKGEIIATNGFIHDWLCDHIGNL